MKERTKARQFAVQALYSWLLTGQDMAEIDLHFAQEHDMQGTDVNYFQKIIHFVANHKLSLIDHMERFLTRSFSDVDPVEQAILLMGVYELEQRMDVPYRVVINEAVEQAKTFGAEDGHKFVNGVLDKVAIKLRETEIKSPSAKHKKTKNAK